MFHACALKFDMIYNLEKFFVFGIELNNALVRTASRDNQRRIASLETLMVGLMILSV